MRLACLLYSFFIINVNFAQVPSFGAQDTLEVATWNIEAFGFEGFGPSDTELQFNNVLDVMRSSNIDLWAVQEMGDVSCLASSPSVSCFESLVDSLNGYEGRVGTVLGPDGFVRMGFVYNSEVITPVSWHHILTGSARSFRDRPPFVLEADVNLGGAIQRIFFITIHMWPGTGATSLSNRKAAGQKLREYVNVELENENVLILGDFNDQLKRSISFGEPSPYEDWVADSSFQFLTYPVEGTGPGSFIPFSSFIDHMVVNEKMKPLYLEASTQVLTVLTDSIPSFSGTTSDHVPVLSRFFFDAVTIDNESAQDRVVPTDLYQNYPNPFDVETSIRFALENPAHVKLEIVNILGQSVTTVVNGLKSTGLHEVYWDGYNDAGVRSSSGPYLYRLTVNEKGSEKYYTRSKLMILAH